MKTQDLISKVPAITLLYWTIKIASTTLGETAGDTFSQSLHLGYLTSSGIFFVAMALAVGIQILSRSFNTWRYWIALLTTTLLGTTLADYADRSLGLGYPGGVALLSTLLLLSLGAWKLSLGNLSIAGITQRRSEIFYWVTLLFSQTLGTALGDWTTDTLGTGYDGGIWIFAGLLGLGALTYLKTSVSRTLLFWWTFVLTRPLGAVVGDFLDKPLALGGLDLSRLGSSLILLAFIVLMLASFRQQAARSTVLFK